MREKHVNDWCECLELQRREVAEHVKKVEFCEKRFSEGFERVKAVDVAEVRVSECRKAVEEKKMDELFNAVKLKKKEIDELRENFLKEVELRENSLNQRMKEVEMRLEHMNEKIDGFEAKVTLIDQVCYGMEVKRRKMEEVNVMEREKEERRKALEEREALMDDRCRDCKEKMSNTEGKNAVKGKEKSKEDKSKPSDNELRNAISDILKQVDLNAATLTDILNQLAKQFSADLTSRRSLIKLMKQDELTKLSNEADDDDDEGKNAVKGTEKSKEDTLKPSDDELRNAICDILKQVDCNTATVIDILNQLAKQFSFDLTSRRSLIKLMIHDELTKLSNEAAAAAAADDDDNDDDEGYVKCKNAVKGMEKSKEDTLKLSDDGLRNAICDILKQVDLSTATIIDILNQLAKQFSTDLTSRRPLIKLMIQDELIKLSNEAAVDDDDDDEGDVKSKQFITDLTSRKVIDQT